MKPLDKRLLRELKNNLGKYIAIFVLLTSTIAFGSSFLIVSDSVSKTLKSDQEVSKLEDGNFTLNGEYNFYDKNIQKNYFVNLEENYMLRIFKLRDSINKISIHEGVKPTNKFDIAIDRTFANSNSIKINDTIKIENYNFKVVGLSSAPDYNSLFRNNNELMLNTTDFGIGFVSDETFSNISKDHSVTYNFSYIGDSDKIKNYLLTTNAGITSMLPRKLNQAITFIDSDMGSDVPTMKIFIYVVVVIIAFVFVVLSKNNINIDSKSIGTLKSMGYTTNEIIIHYMKLPVIITVISAIIGNILAYTVLIDPFKAIYYNTFSLPPLVLDLNIDAFILTTAIPVILMLVINYFMLRNKLSLRPLNFLRGQINKIKKSNVKFPKFLSFNSRFKLRVIFDNLANFIILFFGIFLSSLILLFAIGLGPVLDHYEETVNETFPSNYQYIVNRDLGLNEYSLTQYGMKTYYDIADKDVDVTLVGVNDTKDYFKGLVLKDSKNGVVISDSLSLKLEINIGDNITLKDPSNNKEYTYKVVDIYNYRASYAVFFKQSDLNKLLGYDEKYFNTYLSNKELDIDKTSIIKKISKDDVASVAQQMFESFDELLDMVIIFAVVIYIVLMYVLTKVIIEKNSLNISLMKVFGYSSKEIKKLYLNATTIVIIISLFVVMPLEYKTFEILLKYAMSKVDGYIELYVPIIIYLKVILTGIITYFVINELHIFKVKKISMNDALKDRE